MHMPPLMLRLQQDCLSTGSIPWYPFSPWQNSSELGFAHDLSKALLYVVLVVQVVFPISARRLSNDGQLFLKKLPQKLFFVVSFSAGLSEHRLLYVVLVVHVVFPISARRLSNDGQLFLKCLILIKCGCSCGMNTEKSVPLSERNKVLRLWQH